MPGNSSLVTVHKLDSEIQTLLKRIRASGAHAFLDLTDVTEADYIGHEGEVVRVNAAANGLEFGIGGGGVDTFLELTDVGETDYVGHEGEFVKVNATADGLEFGVGGGGASAFLDLTDVDEADYTGHEGQVVRVNAAENGLEFGVIDAACLWENDPYGIHNINSLDQLFLLDGYGTLGYYKLRRVAQVDGTLLETAALTDVDGGIDICTDGVYFYVCDINDCKIYKYLVSDLSLVASSNTTYGSGNNQFNYPYAICTDGSYLYITDINNYRWVKMRCSDLVWLSAYGEHGQEDDQFLSMRHIATDGIYVWVTQIYGGGVGWACGISMWTVNGGFVAVSTAGYGEPPNYFNNPTRITTDGNYLYYSDQSGITNIGYIVKRTLAMAYVDSGQQFAGDVGGFAFGIATDGEFLWSGHSFTSPTYGSDLKKYDLDLTLLDTFHTYSFTGGCVILGIAIPPAFGNVGIGMLSDPAYRVSVFGSVKLSGQIVSTLAVGTAPMVVTSTTVSVNLNADLLDGHHASDFLTGMTAHDLLSTTHDDTVPAVPVVGDVIYADATPAWTKLAAGSEGNVLTMTSGIPSWKAPVVYEVSGAVAAHELAYDHDNYNTAFGWGDHGVEGYLTSVTAHNLLSATHGDVTVAAVVRGDIIIGSVASPNTKWTALALGAAGTYLAGSATEPSWVTLDQAAVAGLTTASSPMFAGLTIGTLAGILIGTVGVISAITDNSADWNTAYGWGDHSIEGYLTTVAFADLSDYPANAVGVLTNDGVGNLSWVAGGGTHVLLSTMHTDTLADTVTAGDMVIGNATPKWARLAAGAVGQILEMGATLPGWGRKITVSTSDPSGGSDGDLWLKY